MKITSFVAIFFMAGCAISGPSADYGDDDDTDGSRGSATGGSATGGSATGGSATGGSESGSGAGGDGLSSGQGGAGAGGDSSGAGGEAGSDDCYVEPLFANADVSDIVSSYGGSGYKDQVIDAMERRWPAGGYLLAQQKNDPYFTQFSDSSSWTGMVNWLDTLVHEQTHLFNAYHAQGQGQAHALFFQQDHIVYLPADSGFPRSEIMDDIIPAAQSGSYAQTYLTGYQGQRSFNPMLDETNCYANELPGLAAFGQYFNGGVSLRDGSAAFLYFLEVYLRVGRLEYPQFYNSARQSAAYRDAVQTLWLRIHYFYQLADQFPNLGINDALYRTEAHKAANMAEIEMFIGRKVGDSNCLLD